MTDEKRVTVFRSGDPSAKDQATEALNRLTQAGIAATMVGEDEPGVIDGTWEVRVADRDQERADAILAVPLPEPEDEEAVPMEGWSHDLDFVNLFTELQEMEAISIQSVLEASDIPCTIVGSAQYPSLGFEVRVPGSRLEEARQVVEEARQSGAADGENT